MYCRRDHEEAFLPLPPKMAKSNVTRTTRKRRTGTKNINSMLIGSSEDIDSSIRKVTNWGPYNPQQCVTYPQNKEQPE